MHVDDPRETVKFSRKKLSADIALHKICHRHRICCPEFHVKKNRTSTIPKNHVAAHEVLAQIDRRKGM